MIYICDETNLLSAFQLPWVATGKTVQALTWWIIIGNKLVGNTF